MKECVREILINGYTASQGESVFCISCVRDRVCVCEREREIEREIVKR